MTDLSPAARSRNGDARAIVLRVLNWRRRIVVGVLGFFENIRSGLGIRRGVHVRRGDGSTIVYYKELDPVRLHRALSRRGPGFKDYRVTFPNAPKHIVRCSRESCFADLMGPEGLYRYAELSELVRPGARVLDLVPRLMFSGYASAFLADLVGASGAVVSLILDPAMTRFAQSRYQADNLSIECLNSGLTIALGGELAGAFDLAIALDLPANDDAAIQVVTELWRVLRTGGTLVVARGSGETSVSALIGVMPLFATINSENLAGGAATIIHKP